MDWGRVWLDLCRRQLLFGIGEDGTDFDLVRCCWITAVLLRLLRGHVSQLWGPRDAVQQ